MTDKHPNFLRLATLGVLASFIVLLPFSAGAQTADVAKEAQRLTRVAQVAQQEGRFDDAIKAYQTITVVAAREPRIAAAAHLNAGNIYLARGNYHEGWASSSNTRARWKLSSRPSGSMAVF